MTDDVQKTIITSLATAVPLMLMYWLNHKSLVKKVDAVDAKVGTIEKQTNSMKDALVEAARKAGGSEAREKQTDIDKAVAAAMSQPVAAPVVSAKATGKQVKLEVAIEQLTDAANETVEAAEKTVEHADKIKP